MLVKLIFNSGCNLLHMHQLHAPFASTNNTRRNVIISKQTYFIQCCPFMVSVVKGKGETLREKVTYLYNKYSMTEMNFNDFYGNNLWQNTFYREYCTVSLMLNFYFRNIVAKFSKIYLTVDFINSYKILRLIIVRSIFV